MSTVSPVRHANSLSGREWMRFSVSVWSDLRKLPDERRFGHPASFPLALARRLIACYCPPDSRVVCDPFAGVGTTLLAAQESGKTGVGIELSPTYWKMAQKRLAHNQLTFNTFTNPQSSTLFLGDARQFDAILRDNQWVDPFDFIITSPPYWDILRQKRSADGKDSVYYSDSPADLGNETDYAAFVDTFAEIFDPLYSRLIPGGYAIVNVMDLRKGDTFYFLHADIARALQSRGWVLDDLIIWDRRRDYNTLKPLGYPAVFRINRVHEYLLVFRKPRMTD